MERSMRKLRRNSSAASPKFKRGEQQRHLNLEKR
jgi:hypothetical protein